MIYIFKLPGTLHEMLDMVLLLICIWNESRRRNDSNRSGNASSSAPLVHFLRRIEKIGKSTDEDLEEEGKSSHNVISMGVRRGGQEGALAPPLADQNSMFFDFF